MTDKSDFVQKLLITAEPHEALCLLKFKSGDERGSSRETDGEIRAALLGMDVKSSLKLKSQLF